MKAMLVCNPSIGKKVQGILDPTRKEWIVLNPGCPLLGNQFEVILVAMDWSRYLEGLPTVESIKLNEWWNHLIETKLVRGGGIEIHLF